MAAKYETFDDFWRDQSEFIPSITDDDKRKLLIAKGWASEAWVAATAAAEEKILQSASPTNTQSDQSCDYCADTSEAEHKVCEPCLDRLIREGA